MNQATLRESVSLTGKGLHTGATICATLHPAPVDSGIRFRRTDLSGQPEYEALADYQAASQKQQYYQRQIDVLSEAYNGTHLLMDNGKAGYLEVLTAQESLLNSQLSQAMNLYSASESLIALYIALGGGN